MTRASIVMLVLVLVARAAVAEPVAVHVIEVAGETAYLSPGRGAGLIPGTKVTIGGRQLVVVAVTEKTASVKIDARGLAVGAAGTADITPGAAAVTIKLAAPRDPKLFVGQWADPVLPAMTQDPAIVALGSGRSRGRSRLTVIGRAFGAGSRDHAEGDLEGRVIGSFDLMTDRPFAIDADVAARFYSEGYNSGTRTPVYARVAQLRYGAAADPRFALGRLRYAASSIGMLDGGRASLRFGDVGIAAFGGTVPDPLSGKPDAGVARFGTELEYDAATSPWQPRIAVTAHGSTWDGAIDEKRVTVVGSANHGSTWIDGWAEAQAFSSGNPWGASAVELTGAGGSAQWRRGGRYAGVDVAYQLPERSRRLAAVLPLEWLCTPTSEVGDTSTTCIDHDWWSSATASTGIRTSRFAVDAIGSIGYTHGAYRGVDRSAYVRGEMKVGPGRIEAGVAAGKVSFGSWNAVEIGGAYAPTRRLDVSVRYRPELLDYTASTGPILLHSIVADGHYSISTALDLAVSTLASLGSDRNALAMLAIIAWRPLP